MTNVLLEKDNILKYYAHTLGKKSSRLWCSRAMFMTWIPKKPVILIFKIYICKSSLLQKTIKLNIIIVETKQMCCTSKLTIDNYHNVAHCCWINVQFSQQMLQMISKYLAPLTRWPGPNCKLVAYWHGAGNVQSHLAPHNVWEWSFINNYFQEIWYVYHVM